MPIDSAACGSSAMARSEMPTRVLLKKIDRATTRTPAVAAATKSNWLTWIVAEFDRHVNDAEIELMDARAHEIWDRPSITKQSPRVAMNNVICGRLIRGRNTTRSTAIASATIIASAMQRATKSRYSFRAESRK